MQISNWNKVAEEGKTFGFFAGNQRRRGELEDWGKTQFD